MSTTTVKAKLVEIQEAIPGITRAFAYAPHNISNSDLPAIVNFTGPANYDTVLVGTDVIYETRTYLMRLFVKSIAAGLSGEVERDIEPFISLVPSYFASRPDFEDLEGVLENKILGDGGIQVFKYGGQDYLGVEFRIEISEVILIDFYSPPAGEPWYYDFSVPTYTGLIPTI